MDAPRYREVGPARLPGDLRDLLECAWSAALPSVAAGDHHQRVLPDGCMDLLLTGGRVVVAGPDTAAHTATAAPGTVTTGLRFRPGALPALLGVPADALRDRRVDLADVLGPGTATAREMTAVVLRQGVGDHGARLTRDPASAATAGHPSTGPGPSSGPLPGPGRSPGPLAGPAPAAAGTAQADVTPRHDELVLLGLAARLAARDRRRPLPRPLPRPALRALAAGVSAADVADRLGVTTRTLHRTCTATLGYGPSVVRRVLRFRAAAALLFDGHAPADVAARTGYADQPHLSREVRALAGVSPTGLLTG